MDELTRGIAVKMIDRVNIFEDGCVVITYRYQEEYDMALQFVAAYDQASALREVG